MITIITKKLPDDRDGEFDSTTNTIYIDSRICKSRAEATLFHEVLHVLNATLGDSNMGHVFLDSLAEQLYSVFKNNNLLK